MTFTKSFKTTTTQHSSFNKANPQQKANKKLNPSTGKFTEEARSVIPYINGLCEMYKKTLAKYKVRVPFEGTTTMTSVLMHPKDPITDAQKTDNLPLEMPSPQLHS